MARESKPHGPLRRHPFLCLAGVLAAAIALWISYFLATFDLNNYREQLASELSRRLQLPVQFSDARIELSEAGIDLHFTDPRVGSEETPVELRAKKIWLQLAWQGLLLRKPILTEVALDSPQLRIATPPSPPSDTTPPTTDQVDLAWLSDLQIKRAEIQEGQLDLSWHDPAGASRSFSLSALNIELGQIGLASIVTFSGTGELASQAKPARIAVNGSVALPATDLLRDAVWDFALESKGLDASQIAGLLPESAGIQAAGTFDLALLLKGSPAQGVTYQANLNGSGLNFIPDPSIEEPLPLKHLQITGSWQKREGRHVFRQVVLQFNDLRLNGEFSLIASDTGQQITGQLNNSTLPLDTLRQWVPPLLRESNPVFSRRLPGGLMTLSHAKFRAEIPADPQGFTSFSLDELHGEAKSLSWDLGREQKAELHSLTFRLKNNRWHLEQGTGMLAGLSATFDATFFPQSDGQPEFSLDLAISGPTAGFVALQTKPLPEELNLAGTLAFKGHLAGTPDHYRLDAQADLAQLEASYGSQFHLPPIPGGLLTVRGEGTGSSFTVEQGELTLGQVTGQLTGTLDWAETLTTDLSARLQLPELADAYAYAPLLKKLQLRGGVAFDMAAKGPLTTLQPQISLKLDDVSIPAHGIVADITRLNGRLHLKGKSLRSEKLTARLGQSPVTFKARVADLGTPRLELELQAPAVRADELGIFRSDLTVLRDLNGHLTLDRDGLWFAPVKVRLDGGTDATITGSVKNFSDPQVELDIAGEHANVQEIIGLWTDESPAAATARTAHRSADPDKKHPHIRIRVDAKSGDLYGMKFANARALIVPTAEMLLIHPLDFSVGEGSCTSQVVVDYSGPHSQLRVSGHVEDVDAYQIYNELLHRKSILRGSLRGDFYLQGELGGTGFLPTSYGNFNVSVRDGVMRHSPVLGTIFSLLNVSQLFSLQLPDVSMEGVPFKKLTAEFQIDKGVLSSEDVVIDSNAMSMTYVGKYDMVRDDLDLLVVVKPLGTVDKVVTNLPIAGWILGGEERALITAQFEVTGSGASPKVEAIPISAVSKGILGIIQRALSLPLKLIEDPAILWGSGGVKQ